MKEQEKQLENKERANGYPDLMILDMDGTIVIEPNFYKQIYSGTLIDTIREEKGEEGLRTLQYYRENFEGKGELALGALGIPFSKWAAKLNAAPLDAISPRPDIVEKMRSVPSKKVVFTGSPKELAYRILTQFGFDPENDFDLIVGWEEPELSPLKWNCSPFVFLGICDRLGIPPQRTWALGDNWETDLQPPQALGMKTVQINKQSGFPDKRYANLSDMCVALESEAYKPYVVSADIQLILKRWANKRGFVLPDDIVFKKIRDNFSTYMRSLFPNFILISEENITESVRQLTQEETTPIVSLDGNYYPSPYNIELTRLVNDKGENKGLGRRFGTSSLRKQFKDLEILKAKGITEISIFDDVGFSGEQLNKIINILQKLEFTVKNVYLGVAIKDAIDVLQKKGIPVKYVKYFDSVRDEICERDFYPGVPQSGRTLKDSENNIGLPYLLPFGNPEIWASIPTNDVKEFSIFCINQSIELFQAIENASQKVVRNYDIERLPIGINPTEERFVDTLIKIKKELQQKLL